MTKFTDMSMNQVNGWIAWANSHDWADSIDPRFDSATGEMVTASWECDANNIWSVVEARHASPSEMRAWAGY